MTFQSRFFQTKSWLAIVIALTIVGLGGCASSRSHRTLAEQAEIDWVDYEAQIRKVVTEPGRADQIIAVNSSFRQLVKDNVVLMRGYQAKLDALNSNYDATRDQYEAVFRQEDASREVFVAKALEMRDQMATLTTESEWEQLKKYRERSLTAQLEQMKI